MSLLPLPYREGRGAHADGRQLALPQMIVGRRPIVQPASAYSLKKRGGAVTALPATLTVPTLLTAGAIAVISQLRFHDNQPQ